MGILSVDHFQVSIPRGKVDDALRFYANVLGFMRVAKPAELDPYGAWLVQGSVNLHLGEEAEFIAAPHAHPALLVDNIDQLLNNAALGGYGQRVHDGPAGYRRASVFDPFGNRIELMQKL
jgi:catechol 2,3-dioxygenase-like lactoylglutathione lyase family enzyme